MQKKKTAICDQSVNTRVQMADQIYQNDRIWLVWQPSGTMNLFLAQFLDLYESTVIVAAQLNVQASPEYPVGNVSNWAFSSIILILISITKEI